MADTQDVHQIEYRWHPVKDMSPVASSMSADSTQGWDPRIRPWVRHPTVDAPSESVCYQVFPAGMAALAWRYRDRQAAEREGGAQGRPVVSRVLVGQASLLTPDVAVVLCRAGLPATAGPPPGQVAVDTDLPPISAGELTDLVRVRAATLDQQAAHEKGLSQVVAAALSDPDTPLAIQLRDPYIFYAPRDGSQSLLLWGLWRTVWPLLGHSTARRGWSFSTFELPMGDMGTATLPDIVFRLAQAAPTAPPANARTETRIRPGDPSVSAAMNPYAVELAEWLVSEYQETNGDELRQLVPECGVGQPWESRVEAVYDVLRAKRPPVSVSGPAASFAPVSAIQEQVPVPVLTESGEPAVAENPEPASSSQAAAFRPATARTEPALPGHRDVPQYQAKSDYWDDPVHPDVLGYPDAPVYADDPVYQNPPEYQNPPQHLTTRQYAEYPDDPRLPGTSRNPNAPEGLATSAQFSPSPDEPWPGDVARPEMSFQVPVDSRAPKPPSPGRPNPAIDPENGFGRRPEDAPPLAADESQRVASYEATQPYSMRSLLVLLNSEIDSQEFQSILHHLLGSTAEFEERVEAFRQMPKCGWCIPAFRRHGYQNCVDDLAEIFRILVIPDLDRPRVAAALGDWVRQAPPEVTAALVTAAKAVDEMRHSEFKTLQLMTETLGQAGLQKLLEVSGIPFEWPRLPHERDGRPGGSHRSDSGFFGNLLASLGLKRN